MKKRIHELQRIRKEFVSKGRYGDAIAAYQEWAQANPKIGSIVQYNINLLKRRLGQELDSTDSHITKTNRLIEQYRSEMRTCWMTADKLEELEIGDREKLAMNTCLLTAQGAAICIGLLIVAISRNSAIDLFEEEIYLSLNPDINEAVNIGHFANGQSHFLSYGKKEGRSYSIRDAVTPALRSIQAIRQYASTYVEQAVKGDNRNIPGPSKEIHFVVNRLCMCINDVYSCVPNEDRSRFTPVIYEALNMDVRLAARESPNLGVSFHYEQFGKHEKRLCNFNDAFKSIQKLHADIEQAYSMQLKLQNYKPGPSSAANDRLRPVFINKDANANNQYNIDFTNFTLAAHIHIFYPDLIDECLECLFSGYHFNSTFLLHTRMRSSTRRQF